jgi:hypothetical protein
MSTTITQTKNDGKILVLKLKCKPNNEDKPENDIQVTTNQKKKISWDPKVVDNEFMNKKKTNCCSKCLKKNKFDCLFMP